MDRLKLLTVNIWNRQGPWERRRELLRRGIEGLVPDIVALQEVLRLDGDPAPPSQAEDLAAGLGYKTVFAPAWRPGDGPLAMGNAILTKWPIVEHAHWALPTADRQQGRSLGFALVDAPCGKVPVFTTHLTWQLHACDERITQVRFIDDKVREIVARLEDPFPPVLLGDFNAEPESDEIRFLRGFTSLGGRGTYWADCWAVAGDGGPGYTYHRANPYALRVREPSRRIDYVFSRGPDRALRAEPLAARLVFDAPVDGVWPSDHYGVYAEIQAAPVTLEPL
jgi:endonuclease/exonuclease/phosphatase family metal-dependent hydrolase